MALVRVTIRLADHVKRLRKRSGISPNGLDTICQNPGGNVVIEARSLVRNLVDTLENLVSLGLVENIDVVVEGVVQVETGDGELPNKDYSA
jgi:hypothetical protein